MTNNQTSALLEAIKIIVEKSKSKEEAQEHIREIQTKLKEPTANPTKDQL